jgi:hypothetical protein
LFWIPFGFLKEQLPASKFQSEAKPFSVRAHAKSELWSAPFSAKVSTV